MESSCGIIPFSYLSIYRIIQLLFFLPIVIAGTITLFQKKANEKNIALLKLFLHNFLISFLLITFTFGIGDFLGNYAKCYIPIDNLEMVTRLFGTVLGFYLWNKIRQWWKKKQISSKNSVK
ncbi:MAG: putative membrane protein YfcA [bacterium]|jgi:uncharacterized membrane protein YfcA